MQLELLDTFSFHHQVAKARFGWYHSEVLFRNIKKNHCNVFLYRGCVNIMCAKGMGGGWVKKGQKVCTMYHEHSPKAGRLREQLKLHADQRRQKLNLLAKSRVLIYGNNTFALSNSAILLVVVDHLCMINSRRHFAQNIGPWCKKYMPSRPNDNRHKSWNKLVIAWRTNLHGSNKWQPYHCSECTLGLVSCYTI